MKKRLLSILLMCCMVLTLLPTAAFAEGNTEESPVCTCETACTVESMNADCPACGAEDALPEDCALHTEPEVLEQSEPLTEHLDTFDQAAAAKVLYSDSSEKVFFSHEEAVADFNSSETSTEIDFLSTFYGTVSINKAGTVRIAEEVNIQVVNVGDYDVTIWNDGEITILNAYSSTTLRGSNTSFYGTINNKTEGGTVGDLLFGYTSNWAYYVTEDSQWISRAAASTSSISRVRVMDSPFTYIEITGTGVKKATDEADKYTLTAIRGGTVTLKASTFSVPPTTPAESSMTWGCGGIPDKCVNTVLSAGGDPTLTLSDLPSGTYTLTFTRTAVNKFSVSATLVLTVEETRTAHTVTFDPNGGTLNEGDISSRSVFPGDAYGELPTPTRDSHRFDGWYTAPVGGTKVYETTVVTELEDHTLYAHWTYYHEHCVCGGTLNHTHENVEWQAWDGKSAIEYEQKWVQVGEYTKQGRYVAYVYLTGNVSANLTVAPKHILYLCLNGYSFTCADPSQPAITLTGEDSSKPAELDLCDCVGSGTLGGSNASGGSIRIGTYTNATLYGGTLTGNNVSGNGGAVSVTGGNCSFTMHGGTITGNSATTGGGIYATTGSVTINGGVISNNSAANGGGIYAASGAQFHLNGGEITGNTATNEGGGVYCSNLYSQNTGRCEFYGGTISGNTAQRGGGAYVRVCFIGYRNCRITGNTAAEAGGGLYLVPFASEKRIYMGNVYGSGGTIAPYIYDNTVNSAQNNLYLSDPDTQIQFTSHIDTNADIKLGVYFTGITSNGASVLLNYLQINSESRAKTYLDRIFCDNPEYGLLEIQQDGEYYNLYLRSTISAVKVTLDPNGGTLSAGEESKFVQPDSTYGPLPTPTRDSYRFDGWFTAIDGGTKVEETTIMSSREAHTLYAHWTFLHEHCICGGDTAVGDHTAHTSQVFTAWNGTDAISYTNNTAYVYLSQNVTISSNLVVDGTTLYLCLSGNTFASNGTNKIQVKNGGRLVLCDCAGGGTIKGATSGWGGSCVYLYKSTLDIFGGMITGGKVSGKGGGAIALDDSKCVLNIYGGEISGNNGKNSGGAIFLNSTDKKGGTVNMYGGTIANNTATNGGVIYSACGGTINLAGGTISGNKADNGGVVYATSGGAVNLTLSGCTISGNKATNGDGGVINMAGGTVTISGAKLTGNTSSRYGGAVYLHNGVTATMTSGEISNNQAASEGGAVHVYGTSTFNLSGGKITGNSSVDGGAIYLNREPSILNMSGGVISGNTATGNGGGVYIYRTGSICNLSGGTIENNTAGSGGGIYVNPNNSGQLKLSGAPVVRNNTVSGAANNVYLPSGKTLTIAAPMELGASIGVTTGNTSYPVAFSNAYDEDYSAYFSSDDANAQVAYKNDQILYLVTKDSRTVLKGTMSSDNTKVEKYYDGTTDFPAANFSPSYTGGGFTYDFKDGNGCTITVVFDSPNAGDTKIVTVTVTLTGENAEQFVFENGTTTDIFTIGGTIHKAAPDLELSMSKTEFLKGDWLHETLSVTGVMESAEVTYRYAAHPSLIYDGNDSNNPEITSVIRAIDTGEFWAYATTAETANYRAGRSNAVKFTVLDFCTVKFEPNGTPMPTGDRSRKVAWGRAYGELPVLSREGYTFAGWFTEAEGGTKVEATDTVPSVEEQTLYAHWTPIHEHVYDQEIRNDNALKTPADCLNDAVYYLSCTCGEISTSDSFIAEDTALGHDWGAWSPIENRQHQRTCTRDSSHVETEACSYDGWTSGRYQHWHECKVCGAKLDMENHSDPNNDHKCDACGAKTSDHELTAEKVDDKYLKSAATCIAKAVYYKSCAICGEKGTDTFEIGEKNPDNHTGTLGDWQHNDDIHWKVYSCCRVEAEKGAHHGGTASCTKKAVCEDCGTEYGNPLSHSFTAEKAEEQYLKSAATCTEKAVYYKSCTACGLSSKGTTNEATFTSGDVLDHDWGAWTSNGNDTHTRVCKRDESHTETDNCSGGTATCTAKAVCETCYSEYGEMEAHDFTAETAEEKYLKSAATCTEKAVYYKSCSVCGLSSKGTANEATFTSGNVLGHDWGAWTSNGNGTHTHTCKRDGSHTETDNCSGGEATCTKKAVCEDCKTEYGDLLPHSFTAETAEDKYLKSAATCTEKAVYYKSCTACGLSSKGTADEATFTSGNVLGHDWGAWTSNGNGTHTRTCKRDGSHTETDNCTGGKATCTKKAVCEDCKTEYGDLLPHSFTAETAEDKYLKSAATCTEKAVYYKSCTACGLSSKGTADEATFTSGNVLGHDWGAWTSNGNGTHTHTCKRDGSHTETGNCTGGTAYCTMKAVCEVCNAEYGEKNPENHVEGCELEWIATANEHEQKYSLCGKVITEKSAHSFGDWTIIQWPTSNRNGKKERICEACQYREIKTIPATGFDDDSGYSYYTIKATAGAGGSISPSGNVSVREGRDQTFTITPDKGYAVANVKIDGKSIGAVKSYTFENVRRTHTIEVIFMKANGNPQTGVFVDVATGSYYDDAVDWAVENGITQGTDDTHFSPDGICTRAQAVTFLWRAAGSPEPETRAMPFTDVPVGSYYYDAVLWAVENGITKGTSDTTFSPNMTCSRAQIVAFLWRSEKSPAAGTANPFADVKSTAYYADAVLWAVKENITKGTTNTTFSPDADCTRAQIVTFLWRSKK